MIWWGAKTNLVQGGLLLLLLQLLGRILLPWLCVINEGSDKLEFFNLKKMLYFCHSVLRILVNYRFEKKTQLSAATPLFSLSYSFFLFNLLALESECLDGCLEGEEGERPGRLLLTGRPRLKEA